MIALISYVPERIGAIQVKSRIGEEIVPLIVAHYRIRWCGVVKYIVNIHTEIEAFALHEFDVFAHGQIHTPTSRTGQHHLIEVASYTGLGFLEDYDARVAGKSKRVEVLSAIVLKTGSDIVALGIIHLHVLIAEEKAIARAVFPGDVSAFSIKQIGSDKIDA